MTDASINVSIKYKAGQDATWAVFHGGVSQIASEVRAYFGLEEEQDETLHELILRATQIAQGKAKPAPVKKGAARKKSPESTEEAVENVQATIGGDEVPVEDPPAQDPWAEDAEDGDEPAEDYSSLIADLSAAPDIKSLKKLYVKHKGSGAFEVPEVKKAYNARGRALKAGGA